MLTHVLRVPARVATLARVRLLLLALLLALPLPAALYAQSAPETPPAPAAAPTLAYSSFLGGSELDSVEAVALGPNGDLFVAGHTFSPNFLGRSLTLNGDADIFVARLNATATAVHYLTVIGSSTSDSPRGLAVDALGNAYVTTFATATSNFPIQNAHWPQMPERGSGILFKLNPQGGLVYSTFLPLDVFDASQNVATDAAGNVYVTGAWKVNMEGDTWVGSQIGLLKLSADGQTLLLEKKIGRANEDSGRAVALDKNGAIYLLGVS